jgi:hypothetical protein
MEAGAEARAYRSHAQECPICRNGIDCAEGAALYSAWVDKLNTPRPNVEHPEAISGEDGGVLDLQFDAAGNPTWLVYRGRTYRVEEA